MEGEAEIGIATVGRAEVGVGKIQIGGEGWVNGVASGAPGEIVATSIA